MSPREKYIVLWILSIIFLGVIYIQYLISQSSVEKKNTTTNVTPNLTSSGVTPYKGPIRGPNGPRSRIPNP